MEFNTTNTSAAYLTLSGVLGLFAKHHIRSNKDNPFWR